MFKIRKNYCKGFTPHHFYNRDLSITLRSYVARVSTCKDTFNKNGAGFTLIELLVVIAIVGIMTAIVIVSLQGGRIRKELETNAREFASVVREAQNYALTGKQIGGAATCAFSVTWVDSSTYRLRSTASGDCGGSVTSLISYSLKNGVTVSNFGTVSFALPWAATSIPASPGYIDVSFTKSSSSYHVCVFVEGKVTDQLGVCP